jgi:hypothetical protein
VAGSWTLPYPNTGVVGNPGGRMRWLNCRAEISW